MKLIDWIAVLTVACLLLYAHGKGYPEHPLSDWDYKVAERVLKLEGKVFQLEFKHWEEGKDYVTLKGEKR